MNKQLIEIIDLPKIYDPRGSLTVAEENIHMPFSIAQVEWINFNNASPSANALATSGISDVPLMLVALAGEIMLHIEDNRIQEKNKIQAQDVTLNCPYQGVIIPEGYSLKMISVSEATVLLKIKGKAAKQ